MKVILANEAGGVDVLQLAERDKPQITAPSQVRVKLAAAGVNPLDIKLRSKPAFYPDKLPAILGCDGAGVVEATGGEVSRLNVGDEVYFCHGGLGDEPGNYAEYIVLHEDYCAIKPNNISLQDAAALPLVVLTAWEALLDRANLQVGQTILIHGAAGGVGHVAVQLAKYLGAKIAVTVNTDKQAGLAHSLGAEKIIRYKEQDFVEEVLIWTNGQGADVVLDTVGGEVFLRSMNATRIGGKLVSILATAMSAADVSLARQRNLSLCFELMLTPQLISSHEEQVRQRKILEQAAQLVDDAKLSVLVSHKLPLEQAAEAHQLMEQGSMLGKVILTMS